MRQLCFAIPFGCVFFGVFATWFVARAANQALHTNQTRPEAVQACCLCMKRTGDQQVGDRDAISRLAINSNPSRQQAVLSSCKVCAGAADNWTQAVVGALQACAAAATPKTIPSAASNAQAKASAMSSVGTAQRQPAQPEQQEQECEQQEAKGTVIDGAGTSGVQPPPLCLDTFAPGSLAPAAPLQILPALGLRQLILGRVTPTKELCAAVAQLSTLTELTFTMMHLPDKSAELSAAVTLGQALGQLSSLALLNCQMPAAAGQYLPISLQCLTYLLCAAAAESDSGGSDGPDVQNVAQARSAAAGGMVGVAGVCDLVHLTGLKGLEMCDGRSYLAGVCRVLIPQGVSVLKVDGDIQAVGLQRVQKLKLAQDHYHNHDAFGHKLSNDRDNCVLWHSMLSSAAATCLEQLSLHAELRGRTALPWLSLAANSLARLTSLTKLKIHADTRVQPD